MTGSTNELISGVYPQELSRGITTGEIEGTVVVADIYVCIGVCLTRVKRRSFQTSAGLSRKIVIEVFWTRKEGKNLLDNKIVSQEWM
ncbi:hypothetical protein Bpfe_019293 [Biomphalaria pfeifferi]|uniref:Uncharacterized protein n=1 Tax=Biomphalaria pfeifferi TaxID=112525 RepID=A0AAD8F4F2_BIOPF|nr:hypothetical protein Bpfe_019293 [Biomphalaria pfeifferi]